MEISVVMPSYNYGRFIADAIHSLVGGSTCLGDFAPQTMQSFEIIIVDDASEDDTGDVARAFMKELSNVRYIRNPENLGTAGALNAGIREAEGEWITFLSADDMMETTRLEKMYAMARANPHAVIYDDLKMFAGGQRTMHMPMSDYDFDKLLYKNTMHAGILYPRKAWVESGGYPESFRDGREDWAFNVALGRAGYCGVHVKEPLYLYRWERQNRSLRNAGVDWRITFLNKMQATFPDLYRGERPKMCCGNNKKRAALQPETQSASRSRRAVSPYVEPDFTIGAEGMTLLEYQLTKAGPVVYTGAVTNQRYVFGGKHKRGLVDNRDVPGLIARIEDRRHAFAYAQVIEPPAPVAVAPEKEIVTEPIKEEMVTLPALVAEPAPVKPKRRVKSGA
jgi:glycosyltransferase involved in cell wall biosynthesis